MPSAFKILYSLDEAIDLSSVKSIWNRNRLELPLWLRLALEGLILGNMNPCRDYSLKLFSQSLVYKSVELSAVKSQIVIMT